jgi:cytidylate kinase
VSPLKPAEDAIIIDTSHLGIDEVFSVVLERYTGCFGKE